MSVNISCGMVVGIPLFKLFKLLQKSENKELYTKYGEPTGKFETLVSYKLKDSEGVIIDLNIESIELYLTKYDECIELFNLSDVYTSGIDMYKDCIIGIRLVKLADPMSNGSSVIEKDSGEIYDTKLKVIKQLGEYDNDINCFFYSNVS